MEDKELIKQIKENKEDYSLMLEKYQKMIYSIINGLEREYGDYKVDEKDLFQDASIALYSAIDSYKEERGMKFSSYAYMVIHRAVTKKYYDYLYVISNEASSMDAKEKSDYYDFFVSTKVNEDPVQYHHSQNAMKGISVFYNSLNKEDQKIVDLRLQNATYNEIANKLGINRKKVDNRLYRLKLKFKQIEDDYFIKY